MTEDEAKSISNAIDKMKNLGLICKESLQVDEDDFCDDEKQIELCSFCNHYHDVNNECTEEFEY